MVAHRFSHVSRECRDRHALADQPPHDLSPDSTGGSSHNRLQPLKPASSHVSHLRRSLAAMSTTLRRKPSRAHRALLDCGLDSLRHEEKAHVCGAVPTLVACQSALCKSITVTSSPLRLLRRLWQPQWHDLCIRRAQLLRGKVHAGCGRNAARGLDEHLLGGPQRWYVNKAC